MAWKVIGPFLVSAYSKDNPADAEWNPMMEQLRALGTRGQARVLVFTAGGVPNGVQRAALSKLSQSVSLRTAVLTSSLIARALGAVTKEWFDQVRIFSPDDVEAALTYLGATGSYYELVRRTLQELRAQVDDA